MHSFVSLGLKFSITKQPRLETCFYLFVDLHQEKTKIFEWPLIRVCAHAMPAVGWGLLISQIRPQENRSFITYHNFFFLYRNGLAYERLDMF